MILAAGTAATLAVATAPAHAQSTGTVLGILVECAKIDDPSARLACYDNNMRAASGIARTTVPGTVGVSGGTAPVNAAASSTGFGMNSNRAARSPATPAASTPQGFGGEGIRTAQRFAAPADGKSIVTTVASATMREPGVFLMTMKDNTQWLFIESADRNFREPGKGDSIEIKHASMGSYLAIIDGQEPIRVRRVR
jgi:hypothetical protein